MLFWTCPECGRECSPAVRDCPVCAQASEPKLETADAQPAEPQQPSGGILALAQNLEVVDALPVLTQAPEQVVQSVENGRAVHTPVAATMVEEVPIECAPALLSGFVVEDDAAPAQQAMLVLAEETLAIPVKQTVDSLVRPLVESVDLVAEPETAAPLDAITPSISELVQPPATDHVQLIAEETPVTQPVDAARVTESEAICETPTLAAPEVAAEPSLSTEAASVSSLEPVSLEAATPEPATPVAQENEAASPVTHESAVDEVAAEVAPPDAEAETTPIPDAIAPLNSEAELEPAAKVAELIADAAPDAQAPTDSAPVIDSEPLSETPTLAAPEAAAEPSPSTEPASPVEAAPPEPVSLEVATPEPVTPVAAESDPSPTNELAAPENEAIASPITTEAAAETAPQELVSALELHAEAVVDAIGAELDRERAAIGAIAASFQQTSSTGLLAAPVEIVTAPAPPSFEWLQTHRPHLQPFPPQPANPMAMSAGPQTPTLAGPCLPPGLRNATDSRSQGRSRKSSALPGWVASLIAATLLLLLAGATVQYFGSQGDAKAATPAGSQSAAQGGVAAGQSDALAKSLEISGLRLVTRWNGKQQVRFLIINHADRELSGVTLQVTVKSEGSPILLIRAPIRSLGSNQSKEIHTDLDSDVPASALSDWQSLRSEIRLVDKE